MLRTEEGDAGWNRASGWRHQSSLHTQSQDPPERAPCQPPIRAGLALPLLTNVSCAHCWRPDLLMAHMTRFCSARHAGSKSDKCIFPGSTQMCAQPSSSHRPLHRSLNTTYSTPHWFALYHTLLHIWMITALTAGAPPGEPRASPVQLSGGRREALACAGTPRWRGLPSPNGKEPPDLAHRLLAPLPPAPPAPLPPPLMFFRMRESSPGVVARRSSCCRIALQSPSMVTCGIITPNTPSKTLHYQSYSTACGTFEHTRTGWRCLFSSRRCAGSVTH